MVRFLLISAILLSTVQPAVASGRCTKPYAPVFTTSAPVTKADLARMRTDVQAFLEASDVYQQCLIKSGRASSALIASNQAEKERVGRAFNALAKVARG